MSRVQHSRAREPRPPSAASQAFTLAELLAVITIMAIMIAAAVPALNGLARGASLRGATIQIKSALNLGRQYAITHRQTVFMMFPTWDNDNTGADTTRTRGYRAYALCTVSNNAASFLSDWQFLPPGVIIQANSDMFTDSTCSTNTFSGLGLIAGKPLTVVRFKTDGSVQQGSSGFYIHIYLGEGYIDNSGNPVLRGNSGTNAVVINMLTGTVKVQ